MAVLLPNDFDLSALEHSEQRVCRSFLEGLDDTWLVIPHVPVTIDGVDRELDVVLVSGIAGVVLVEVKGGAIEIKEGRWLQNGTPLARSPMEQVKEAKHVLVKRLRSARLDLDGLFVSHVVALPDVGSVPKAGLTPDAPADIVFGAGELAVPDVALAHFLKEHGPIPHERLASFVAALRPDIRLERGEGDVVRVASKVLNDEARVHLASARELDANRRVLVTGGAGTGKTMVAEAWARRAMQRGERVLFACFNKPLAQDVQRRLQRAAGDVDVVHGVSTVMVGTYHDLAIRLLEPHGFRVGANPPPEYWLEVVPHALEVHAASIGTPFDTVIVDEGQDLHEHWIASLERLLDPAGPRRLLMTADPDQRIYVTDWSPPADMMTSQLIYNLRNSRAVARMVHRLGGPEPLPGAPVGLAVEHLEANGPNEVRKRVRDAVVRLAEQHHVPFSQIAVLTTTKDLREDLLANPKDGAPLARWEDRSEETVLCETVQRTKGLERTAVIVVDTGDEPKRRLLYIGASRAVAALFVVAPTAHALAQNGIG